MRPVLALLVAWLLLVPADSRAQASTSSDVSAPPAVPATPALVVFPRFIAGQPASLTPVDPGSAMPRLARKRSSSEL